MLQGDRLKAPSSSVSGVAELGQQWFGALGQEPVLSLVTDLHQCDVGEPGLPVLPHGIDDAVQRTPSRICSQAGPDTLGRLRRLLSG